MAVFRIEKTRDYTVMSNYHLRDMSLSLKAKGLLSLMLSLPENWDYTMKGLARICKDGIDSISGGIRELEAHGYLIRARVRGANGQLGSIEYTILEQPKTPSPTQEKPIRENPVQANPMLDAPIQENPAQLNKEESSNYLSKTDLSITEGSSPIQSSPPAPRERIGQDGMRKRESYRALILENIEYDVLSQNVQLDKDRLDELVELMVDTVCSNREMIRVAGDDYPAEVVRSRFLKLNTSHIEYVLDRMYAVYMSTLGNRPDLFPSSGYVGKYIENPPTAWDIPAEYLTDERFATLITEAEKYLGYPYVWGGSSPETSFDCSGFVSYVLTNTGLCNTGRLGAQGLYNISTPVSDPQPGDLVFFVGTYDTSGISHVGIYVGDGMMLHCGDPISYTNLNTSYWQSHFYAYGRPPYN